MNPTCLFLLLSALLLRAEAGEFRRSSTFGSVKDFVTAASGFRPAATKTDLSVLFRLQTETEDLTDGKPVTATAIDSCVLLWSNDVYALVFATAHLPNEEMTRSLAGVLFLIERKKASWHIADLRRFSAWGKFANVSADLTSEPGRGLDEASMKRPVVTITENTGGGGGSYSISGSYALVASQLKLLKPE